MRFLASVRLIVVGALCAASLCLAAPASADELQDCIDAGNAQGIDLPTCVEGPDGTLVPTDGGEFGGLDQDAGIPGWFWGLFVLVALGGIGATVWRVSMARKLASDAGMDPDVATGITLIEEDGLSATYLASSLRGSQQPAAATSPAADRLGELKDLLDRGLITQAEHDERRKAIIDSV